MARQRRYTRPALLDPGKDITQLHVKLPKALHAAFAAYCGRGRIGASQLVREAMEAMLSNEWTPPAMRRRATSGRSGR